MNRSLKGICFTVAGGCCWGMSGVMGKYLFDAKDLTATWLVTVRLLGAGICLLLLMYQRKGNSIFREWKRKDSAVNQLIFGMIGMAMCQMTYFLAIQESNPGTATVLQYSAPILIMVFFVIIRRIWYFRDNRMGNVCRWSCILRNDRGVFLLSPWDFHVRTSSGKYAWMRGTAGCNDSFRNRAWTGLWNDRCCWNLMYCWSSDGIDGFGCVIRHYGFAFEGKKVLIGG